MDPTEFERLLEEHAEVDAHIFRVLTTMIFCAAGVNGLDQIRFYDGFWQRMVEALPAADDWTDDVLFGVARWTSLRVLDELGADEATRGYFRQEFESF